MDTLDINDVVSVIYNSTRFTIDEAHDAFNNIGHRMIRPLQDRIIIKRDVTTTTTQSGLILTGTSVKKAGEGVVTAIGPGRYDEKGVIKPLEVAVGDRVAFSPVAGTEVEWDGDTHLILHEAEIIAIVRP